MAVLKQIKSIFITPLSLGEGLSLPVEAKTKAGVRLKGSTLIESIVATIVIMFSFSAVTTIYVNVFKADDHARKFNGQLALKNIALKIKAEKDFLDGEFKLDSLSVEKTISRYGEVSETGQQVWALKLKLFDSDKKLLSEYKELLMN